MVPWNKSVPPAKILVMRFQAIGDVVITLPWLQSLKDQFPQTEIHFLTRQEAGAIPSRLPMFTKVFQIGGRRNARLQFALSMMLLPVLWFHRYDMVIDLQNHRISKILRRLLLVKQGSIFDRSAPRLAGIRTREALVRAGFPAIDIAPKIKYDADPSLEARLKAKGWDPSCRLIILNPAGAFETRNWPLENYVSFAERWIESDSRIQFLMLGFSSIAGKAEYFKERLGSKLIDLTGETNSFEAFALVKKAMLILSEDSGLMHMAWVQHVPTLSIFGSTRSDWSAPMGDWSFCFNSSNLPCGNCLLEKCLYNDNHCLTRWSPEMIFLKSKEMTSGS